MNSKHANTAPRAAAARPAHRAAPAPTAAPGRPRSLRATAPDRDAGAFLRLFNLVAQRPVDSLSVAQSRLYWRLLALALGRRERVAQIVDRVIDGPAGPIELRVFRPFGARKQPRPAFVWYHGGGFMVGGLDTSDSICRTIARSGCIVVAVRYRLAPEHDLLAGREDCLAALEWIADHGAAWGIDPTRLAVGGDSAGGNLAAAVAQAYTKGLRDQRQGRAPLRLQVLAYPATELVDEFPSLAENERGFMITSATLASIKRTVGELANATDPWLSPQRSADLRGLPPALVVSAGFDPIRDDGLEYAARLRAAGVPVQLLHYAGQFHGFLNFDGLLAGARDALQRTARALAVAFHGEPLPDCTLEIADDGVGQPTPPFGSQAVATALMACEATGLWAQALTRLAVPIWVPVTAALTRPWTLPLQLLREHVPMLFGRLHARQTHPAVA